MKGRGLEEKVESGRNGEMEVRRVSKAWTEKISRKKGRAEGCWTQRQ